MKTENRQTGQRAQPKKKHLVAAQGGSGNSARCMQCYRERNYIRLPDVASKYIMPRHSITKLSAASSAKVAQFLLLTLASGW